MSPTVRGVRCVVRGWDTPGSRFRRLAVAFFLFSAFVPAEERPRIRDLGVKPGVAAIEAAAGTPAGPVAEGSVGAGTGTSALGWKGGIGTSSRVLPAKLGGYTVGALVQSNFGGILTIDGARVGELLGRYDFKEAL